MSLKIVNYSDSSSDEEIDVQQIVPVSKIDCKLPNPFGKSIEVSKEEEDDAAQHDGRARNFPHERGNWVTYIYVHCPKTDFIRKLQDQFQNLLKSANTLENVQFHVFEELHMSLTRTVVLRHHWIDEFVRSVEQSLTNAKRFWIHLNSIQIYCNDNKTRTFISLSFADTNSNSNSTQNLQYIVNQLNGCLNEFKLTAFYEDASYHVSILWCLGDRRKELQSLVSQFRSHLEKLSSTDDSNFTFNVQELFSKIGNKLYTFQL